MLCRTLMTYRSGCGTYSHETKRPHPTEATWGMQDNYCMTYLTLCHRIWTAQKQTKLVLQEGQSLFITGSLFYCSVWVAPTYKTLMRRLSRKLYSVMGKHVLEPSNGLLEGVFVYVRVRVCVCMIYEQLHCICVCSS